MKHSYVILFSGTVLNLIAEWEIFLAVASGAAQTSMY